jgi:hypothetical protein
VQALVSDAVVGHLTAATLLTSGLTRGHKVASQRQPLLSEATCHLPRRAVLWGCEAPTRKELEAEARRLDIKSRSKVGKDELERAIARAT